MIAKRSRSCKLKESVAQNISLVTYPPFKSPRHIDACLICLEGDLIISLNFETNNNKSAVNAEIALHRERRHFVNP